MSAHSIVLSNYSRRKYENFDYFRRTDQQLTQVLKISYSMRNMAKTNKLIEIKIADMYDCWQRFGPDMKRLENKERELAEVASAAGEGGTWVYSSKYGSPPLYFTHYLASLHDERAREMKRRLTMYFEL